MDYTQIKREGIAFVEHVKSKTSESIFNIEQILENSYHSQHNNLITYGYIKEMGYIYYFNAILNKYIAKDDTGIHEYYCINKTILRKALLGKVCYIIELKKAKLK